MAQIDIISQYVIPILVVLVIGAVILTASFDYGALQNLINTAYINIIPLILLSVGVFLVALVFLINGIRKKNDQHRLLFKQIALLEGVSMILLIVILFFPYTYAMATSGKQSVTFTISINVPPVTLFGISGESYTIHGVSISSVGPNTIVSSVPIGTPGNGYWTGNGLYITVTATCSGTDVAQGEVLEDEPSFTFFGYTNDYNVTVNNIPQASNCTFRVSLSGASGGPFNTWQGTTSTVISLNTPSQSLEGTLLFAP